MKELFCEVDMVIMPSKSEGFGLVALEALSAGLPILVGSNSGFARAIQDIPFRSYSVVDSEYPSKWAECVERVHERHRVVLRENKMLKEHYSKEYCWKTQCEDLVDRLWKMVYGTSAGQAIATDDLVEQCPSVVTEPVCLPDPTTMQQLIGESAVTSSRGKEGTSGDELTLPELAEIKTKLNLRKINLKKTTENYLKDRKVILESSGIQWSVENNETDRWSRTVGLKYYSGSTFLSTKEAEEKCLRAGTPDTRAVNKLAMNAGIIIV